MRPGRRSTRATRGEPVTGRRIMTADEIRRAMIRISHEIVEKQAGTDGLVARRHPAPRRAARPAPRGRDRGARGRRIPVGALDITFYRDDLSMVAQQPVVKGTDLPFDVKGAHGGARRRRAVHRPDDPGGDGRAGRLRPAAGDPAGGARRPGHRELPIRADHVGKNVPTSREESSGSSSTRWTARTRWTSNAGRAVAGGGRR